MKGIFITLEGGDGAGKSTQIDNIKKYFEAKGYSVLLSREPGGTQIGEMLRDIVLDRANSEMDDVTEMLVYAASRAQHVSELVIPALEEGKVVICDRYVDSSIAYQGYGRELGTDVKTVNDIATRGLRPDITFWLDIDPELGKKRAGNEGELDRLESEKLDFHYRLREGYKAICEAEPDRVKRIDASESVEEMKQKIYEQLDRLLENR